MPVAIEIDTSAGIVFSTFDGVLTEQDVRLVAIELARRSDFNPAFSHIIDFHRVTAVEVSSDFIRTFAHERPLFHRAAKQIIVAPEAYMFGMARMVQILRESQLPNIEVVRSLEAAYALLKK